MQYNIAGRSVTSSQMLGSNIVFFGKVSFFSDRHKDRHLVHPAHMGLVVRKPGFPTRSDTNRAVQSQKMARGFKFRI